MKPLKLTTLFTWLSIMITTIFVFVSCQKNVENEPTQEEIATAANQNKDHGHLQQTKTFSADVVIRWLNMQLDMLRVPLAPGTGSQGADRALAYCGIATYEAVVPG